MRDRSARMVWKYNKKTINIGRAWTDDKGNQYPSNWMSLTSDAEKKAVGLAWEDDPKPFDIRFYYSADKAKPLNDVNEVDGDGKAILDEYGNQVVTFGLKTTWINQTKNVAKNMLAETDWYVTRKAESGTAIPDKVTTYRAAVRTASANIEKSITDVSDVAALIALFDAPVDSNGKVTGKAPMYNWPDPL